MKTKIISIASAILLLATAFTACKKEEDFSTERDNFSLINQQSPNGYSALSYNQLLIGSFDFNEFGKEHNSYLDYIRANPSFYNMTNEQRFLYGKTYPYLIANTSLQNETWIQYNAKINHVTYLVDNLFTIDSPSVYLLNNGLASPKMASFYNELSEVYKNSIVNGNMITPATFANNVFDLLISINSNSIIVDTISGKCNDEGAIFIVASIAVFSYNYWYNNYENWFENNNVQTLGLRDLWYRIRRGAADSYGFTIKPWYREGGVYIWDYNEALMYSAETSDAVNY